jgi:hypothetical protein
MNYGGHHRRRRGVDSIAVLPKVKDGAYLGKAIKLMRVKESENSYTKKSGGNTYNAYATFESTAICVKSQSANNKHTRIGLTTNKGDNHGYPNGKYIGLFPNGRMYKPPYRDSSYNRDTVVCLKVEGSDIVAYKDNVKMETWKGAIKSGKVYAKLFFHEVGAALKTVQLLKAELPSADNSEARSQSCTCIPCGSSTSKNYGSGFCGPATGSCSASRRGAGCYSSRNDGCDCKTLKTRV